jgi:hypothetical protein
MAEIALATLDETAQAEAADQIMRLVASLKD